MCADHLKPSHHHHKDSLVVLSLRSFLIALFAVFGLAIGFFLFAVLIGSIASISDAEKETYFKPEIAANSAGDRTIRSSKAPIILKINVMGVIGTEMLNMHTVRQQLIESRENFFANDRVKALLIHIESPGGTVIDSDGIYRALLAYKERFGVPVYGYVDGLSASGAMYIASACDKLYASDVSLIGSVGVIPGAPFFNVVNLLDKIGVTALTLSAGTDKDALNPFREWKPDEDASMKAILDFYYKHFVNVVASGRPNLDKTKLVDEYGARVFPSPLAKEYGFIDYDNASLGTVIEALAKDIGIDNDYYQVVELTKRNWYTELFKGENSLLKGEIKHRLDISLETDKRFAGQFLYLYRTAAN